MSVDPQRLHDLTIPAWTRAREDEVLRRLDAPQRDGARWPWAVAAAFVAAVGLAFFAGRALQDAAPAADTELAAAPQTDAAPIADGPDRPQRADPPAPAIVPLTFRDGTVVVPSDARSEVVIAGASENDVRLQLRRGGARFDVTPDPERRFAVEAGAVTVEVLGTEFDCHRDGDRVAVTVLRGRVKVSWADGSRVLAKGESGTFPPAEPAAARPERAPKPEAQWRRLARRGEQARAFDALKSGGKVANRAEELMLAADVARKAGHPAAALPYLRQVLDRHPKDSRAPLAAFTIGRIELRRHNYQAAAEQFVRVQRTASASLAEHALAREVEAWVGARKPAKAKRRAADYLRRYPTGPRAAEVRRITGATKD